MPDDVKRNVDTEGGAAIEGSVNTGGDFVGRDQETHVGAQKRVYFVSETKGSLNPTQRRGTENMNIACTEL
jgi:hypothetical protein